MRVTSVACLLLAVAGCQSQGEEPLPPIESISEMRVALYNRPDSGPDIDEFLVSPKEYGKVLALFDDRQLDKSVGEWQVLGYVKIKGEVGAERAIYLFWTGDNRGAFSIDGTYYRGSSDREIISVLHDCHTAVQNEAVDPTN